MRRGRPAAFRRDARALTCRVCPSPPCLQVWSLEQPEWHCRIDEGSAGLVASCWSPDGRHVLNTTEFHVSAMVRVCARQGRVAPRPFLWGLPPSGEVDGFWGTRCIFQVYTRTYMFLKRCVS